MKTVLGILLAASSASAAQIWIAPSATKVRPLDRVPGSAPTTANIFAAQNEFESFHVVVSGAATGVSMVLEGVADGAGHAITGRDVRLYREALINIATASGGDGATGWWPDALVPDVDPLVGEKRNAFPFDVPAGENRAVFVDIHVPATAPAGVYRGVINVSGSVTAQVPVVLTVWDFAVPSTSTLRSAFGLNWNAQCMGHGNSDCMDNYVAEMQLRARYVQTALDNHISIRSPYYGNAISASGSTDWSDFDLYSQPFFDGTANTRLQGARLTAVSTDGWAATQTAGWAAHFKQKGWSATTVFDYVCDEPPATCNWSDIPTRDTSSHAGSSTVPTLVTTTTQSAQQNGATGIDLFSPVIDQMENKPGMNYAGNQRAKYPAYIWWYQSCDSFGCGDPTVTGWPSYAIDTDGTRNRAFEWMSFNYDVSGELYYETAMAYYLGTDPWVTQEAFGGNGDGDLFYPGTVDRIGGRTEIPIESLRMKGIRDGMEDYELLHLAASLGLHDQALAISQSVFPVTYHGVSTAGAIDAARAELAAMILNAMNKTNPPDAGTPAPDGGIGPADAGSPGGAADAGPVASADAGDQGTAPPVLPVEPDAGTGGQDNVGGAPPNGPSITASSVGGGCTTTGASVWMCLGGFAVLARRRRRITAR